MDIFVILIQFVSSKKVKKKDMCVERANLAVRSPAKSKVNKISAFIP